MRRAGLIAVLMALALTTGARAQDDPLPDPIEVLDRAMMKWRDGDLQGYAEDMGAALRRARQEDRLSADWAFIFGTFSDFMRNEVRNSPYALRLSEEGLAYLAPEAGQNADLVALLQVTRVYALADLGRYGEAATAARLAEPIYRATMGAALADDLVKDIAAWEVNQPTVFNNAPTDLARATLKEAADALDRGEYGHALTLAARATLPEGTGLDPDDVRRINAAAAAMTGRALYWLNRRPEAADVLRRAAATITEPGWENQREPSLSIDPGAERGAMAELFFWLARSALEVEDYGLVLPSLHLAEELDDGRIDLLSILYTRSAFYGFLGSPEESIAELRAAIAKAEAEGNREKALLSRYYLAAREISLDLGDAGSTSRLIDLTRQMVREGSDSSFYDPVHIRSESAQLLLETEAFPDALEFARSALAARLQSFAASSDSRLGQDGQRAQVRSLVEALLRSAHGVDSESPGADCSRTATDGMGCVIFYEP